MGGFSARGAEIASVTEAPSDDGRRCAAHFHSSRNPHPWPSPGVPGEGVSFRFHAANILHYRPDPGVECCFMRGAQAGAANAGSSAAL